MYPVIDCHCHIYPSKIARKAVDGIGDFYDINMHEDGTAEDMLKKGKEAGITHFMIFSVATKPSQTESINKFIASEADRSGGIMSGLGTIHPDSADLKGDIERIIDLGLKGVKIHPDFQGFKLDDYRYLKMYELCEGRLPVLIHTGDKRYDFSNPNRLKPILETFTDLTVIGAHFGGWSIWEKAAQELYGYKNLYVDCSSSLYALTPLKAKSIVRLYTADKVIFGTDYPMWNASEEMKRFKALNLTDEENEKILYKNAAKIFKLKI
jgi:predicted TIM-barrel fold metal-dependent hydrolase